MKNLLFDSWHQWKVCMMSGIKNLSWGFFRVISCLFLGILSVFRWLWRLLVKGAGKYPAATIVISLAACIAIWLVTMAKYKSRVVTAEYQRDTIAYRLQQFEQMYDGNTDSLIVVRKSTPNDTLTFKGYE